MLELKRYYRNWQEGILAKKKKKFMGMYINVISVTFQNGELTMEPLLVLK